MVAAYGHWITFLIREPETAFHFYMEISAVKPKLWNKNFLLLKLNLDLHTQYLAMLNRTFNKIYLSCLEFAHQSSMVDIWKCPKKASELKATTSCLLRFKITKLRKCRQYLGQKLYQKRYKHVYVQRVSLVSV